MKIRRDFVTNSSSSSFVIEKNQLSYGKLLKYLLKIANIEAEVLHMKKSFDWNNVEKDCVAGKYYITDATEENPYKDYYEDFWDAEGDYQLYDNHYIIDNNDCGSYDWSIIEKVLGSHNIEWKKLNCDD